MRLLIYILFFVCCGSMAQQPVSVHITEKDGLPDKEFYGIAEDSKGFIWLAGNSGLTRYDGKNYTTFNHPEKRGLSVFEVQVDVQDRVWCINISGQIFYFEDGELHLFKDLQSELNGTLPSMKIIDQQLVIMAHRNTFVFDVNDKSFKKIDYSTNGQIYIEPFQHKGKLLFHDNSAFIDAYNQLPFKGAELPQEISAHVAALDGDSMSVSWNEEILLLTQNKLAFKTIYLSSKNGWREVDLPEEMENLRLVNVKTIDQKIWITSSSGVLICDIIKNKLVIESHLYQGVFISDVWKDRDSNYWFTTLKNGIEIIPNILIKKIQLLENLGPVTRSKKGLDNKLVIGFENGKIIEYDQKNLKTRVFQSYSNRAVTEIVVDTARMEYLVIHKLKATRYAISDLSMVDKDLVLTSTKKLSFIDQDHVVSVNSNSGSISNYPSYNKDLYKEAELFINKRGYSCLYDSSNGKSYLGMVDELVCYDKNLNQTIITFKGEPILSRSMTLATDGSIWINTFSKGLLHLKNDKIVQNITEKDGLFSDVVQQIAVDDKYLWAATKKGIQKIDPETLTFKNLTQRDGILSYDIHDIIVQEKQVLFSSSAGIFTADKQNLFKKFKPIEVYFTDIKINKQEQELLDSYKVNSEKSALSISFNSAGYRGKTSGTYTYRMLGMDSEWTTVPSGSDLIQYGNLPEGNYTFQLKATDVESDSNPLKEIKFESVTVFYKKLWFWFLLASALVLLVVFYYRRKLRFRESEKNKQLSQLQREKEFINLKLENLRSQMNPHFVFNALNSIQDYIVRNHKTLASDYLGKFADLIRTYLEHSVKSRITLAEEMETLEMYLELEKLRFEDKLTYQVTFDENEIAEHISIPTMLVQPYVENSLKHGLLHKKDDRQLHIIFEYCKKEELLTCTIKDNGVGRKKAMQIKQSNPFKKDSFAIKATEDRLRLLNYGKSKNIGVKIIDLIENGSASGTKVIVTIPHKITSYESNNHR